MKSPIRGAQQWVSPALWPSTPSSVQPVAALMEGDWQRQSTGFANVKIRERVRSWTAVVWKLALTWAENTGLFQQLMLASGSTWYINWVVGNLWAAFLRCTWPWFMYFTRFQFTCHRLCLFLDCLITNQPRIITQEHQDLQHSNECCRKPEWFECDRVLVSSGASERYSTGQHDAEPWQKNLGFLSCWICPYNLKRNQVDVGMLGHDSHQYWYLGTEYALVCCQVDRGIF